ncbi:autotransporter domain-containing protein [Poriferisphaera sp. WC338]|uniref:autotransporter family protein n=1 Tax=Poriferisphaera sp. WC338 TaxID=3425129 RepID=UPI003D814124
MREKKSDGLLSAGRYRPGTLAVGMACLGLCFVSGAAFAENDTEWHNATGDSNWATGGNWTAGVSVDGDVHYEDLNADTIPDLVFRPSGITFIDDISNTYEVNGIGSVTNIQVFVFEGTIESNYTLNGTGTITTTISTQGDDVDAQKAIIKNNSAYQHTINNNFRLRDKVEVDANLAGFVFNGDFNISSGTFVDERTDPDTVTPYATNVIFMGDNDITVNGVISGTGSIVKDGIGTLALNGQNLYQVGTTINAGKVIMGNKLAFGISDVTIGGASELETTSDFRITNQFTFQNDLSFVGSNDLLLGAETAATKAVFDSSVTFTVADDITFGLERVVEEGAGPGTYSITKLGNGILTFGTTNAPVGGTFTTTLGGALNVNAGTAVFNKYSDINFGGGIAVANGASLYLGGTVNSTINTSGTIHVGAMADDATTDTVFEQIDTATLTENLVADANSNFVFGIADNATFDQINLTGAATADLNGTYTFAFIDFSAAKIAGSYDLITSVAGITDSGIVMDADMKTFLEKYFTVTETVGANAVNATFALKDFDEIVISPELASIAGAVQNIKDTSPAPGSEWDVILNEIDTMNVANIEGAIAQMMPEDVNAMQSIGINMISAQTNNVNSRMDNARHNTNIWQSQPQNFMVSAEDVADPEEQYLIMLQTNPFLSNQSDVAYSDDAFDDMNKSDKIGFFVNGFGTFGDIDSAKNMPGYDFKTGGALFGGDYRIDENLLVGAFMGFSVTDVEIDSDGGSSDVTNFNGGVYASYFKDGWYVNGQAGLGYNQYDNKRVIVVGATTNTAESDPTGLQFSAAGTIGYDWKVNDWTIGPYGQFEYATIRIDEYTEEGAGVLNLQVEEATFDSFLGRVGARAALSIDMETFAWLPEARIAYQHQFMDQEESLTARFQGGAGSAFNFTTRDLGDGAFIFGLGTNAVDRVNGRYFYANYDAELGDEYSVHTISGGIRLTF